MLQVARLSPKLLGDSTELVGEFLRTQLTADGGFQGRDGKSDLYYTAFGIQGLLALQLPLPVESLADYLLSFGQDEDLDLVHTACLARCWASISPRLLHEKVARRLLARIESHRTTDGGYDSEPGAGQGTLYGCFLALGAYEDLGQKVPEPEGLLHCITALRTPDGGYANEPGLGVGLTPSAAAAETLLRHLGRRGDGSLEQWLLGRLHPQGGFVAVPNVPIPDLLSTATALHALSGMQADFEPIREACLDFIDTLWNARGGFYGTWEDDHLDCEYTYYGLLALGHLSL